MTGVCMCACVRVCARVCVSVRVCVCAVEGHGAVFVLVYQRSFQQGSWPAGGYDATWSLRTDTAH